MGRPIVTLTTDWGHQSFFAGMVKGRLHSLVEDVEVVDVAHHVEPFNVRAATFVVRHGCLGFPAGTVHIVDVASTPEGGNAFVALKVRGQYFICCDNGLPSMAFGDEVEEAVSLPLQENRSYTFAAYSVFAVAAARLLCGTPLGDLGPRVEQLRPQLLPSWVREGDEFRIPILYTDSYGNAYLAMSYREFLELGQNRPFVMRVREERVTEVSATYHSASALPQRHARGGRGLHLTVSATGQLELSCGNGSFVQMFDLRADGMVMLEFK